MDLLRHFNWTYISTIYSENNYGEPGIDAVHTLAMQYGICIDISRGIDSAFTDEKFSELAAEVVDSEANVIVLFLSEHDATKLFEKLQPIYSGNFTWIGSDSVARSRHLQTTFGSILMRFIGFVPRAMFTSGFFDYFSNLTLDSNVRNPWLEEWFTSVLDCSATNGSTGQCPRNQSVPQLLDTFQQGQKTPLVVDAVYAFAHALHNFLLENCEQSLQWFSSNRTCLNQRLELNGSTLLQYVQRVNFSSPTGARVTFDDEGNAPGNYDIINHQVISVGGTEVTLSSKTVGKWTSVATSDSTIHFMSPPQFGLDAMRKELVSTPPESHCNRCPPGHYRRQVQSSCCGICDPCLGRYYSSGMSSLSCSMCGDDSWGNNPLVGSKSCVALQEVFVSFGHPYSIIILIIALVGLLLVCTVLVIFVYHWKIPVVKSSGREQMITLLVGISLSYLSAFFYVSPPHPVSCGLQRWSLWTAFSIMFGALLVKVIRVARIFLQKPSLSKPKFTEPHYQVLFTAMITSVQLLILVISTSVNVPKVLKESRMNATNSNVLPTLVVTCRMENSIFFFISLAYQSMLIFLCTVFGAMSFKYPENFNEAKYIALCSVSVSVIWIAFIVTFFAIQSMQEFQNIAISLAMVMSGYAVLLPVFGPKIYILLFKPKKDNPSFSLTASVGDTPSKTTLI